MVSETVMPRFASRNETRWRLFRFYDTGAPLVWNSYVARFIFVTARDKRGT
jgi:hypothetical protein